MKQLLIFAAAGIAISTSALAEPSANEPAPGYAMLMNSDFANAERVIREASVSKYDPARSINLGVALAKTGQAEAAEKQFRRALLADDVQVVVANGKVASSHDVAARALDALERGELSR